MAHITGSVLFVKADALSGFPEVVQKFVDDYFKPIEIFGVECFYAFRELDGRRDGAKYGDGKRKGVAPSHSFYLREKVDGELSLYDWLEKMVNNKDEPSIFQLTEHWEDGRHVNYD